MRKSEEFAEKIGRLRDILGAIAEGGPSVDGYREFRDELLADDRVAVLLPDFIVERRSARNFWNCLQPTFSSYARRTQYIQAQLLPIERQFRPDRQKAPAFAPWRSGSSTPQSARLAKAAGNSDSPGLVTAPAVDSTRRVGKRLSRPSLWKGNGGRYCHISLFTARRQKVFDPGDAEMKDHRSFARSLVVSVLFTVMCATASLPVRAGGLLGDAINVIAPGVGTALDDAHRQIKDAIPPYKAIEEGASHVVNETFVQTGAPALQELIAQSRDDALRAGVQPIPFEIRQNLSGFISDHVLNVARYRVQGGGDLTLQVNAIRYGEAAAITLDYVIVFAEHRNALYNPTLWAHELAHVDQFQQWGIRDFSIRYLRDYNSVEQAAYEAETRYAAWVGVRNSGSAGLNQPAAPFAGNRTSSTCGTAVGSCLVNGSAPVGTPCWCNTPMGAATGALVPTGAPAVQAAAPRMPPPAPAGLPSGYGMQACGCWGPNPVPTASEPRCASGMVRINVCPGFCAPGHPLYAYVCV